MPIFIVDLLVVGRRARRLFAVAAASCLVACSSLQPASQQGTSEELSPVTTPATARPRPTSALPFTLEPAPAVVELQGQGKLSLFDLRAAPRRSGPPYAGPPDAVPRIERIATGHPNAPYAIKGVGYEPFNGDLPMKETGIASWYGADFHGRPASTGERFDMLGMTAAHPTMPLPSYAIVRNLDNGRQVIVRVNDRGPFIGKRIIDLSFAAARKLGINGLGRVEVERITHADIRTGAWKMEARESFSTAQLSGHVLKE